MFDDFDDDEPIYVVEFSGRDADWTRWVQRFAERAREMRFDGILDGTIKAPPEIEKLNLDTEEGKKKAKARKQNEEAYSELVLSISTRESCGKLAFHAVKSSKTQDLPSGNAYLAWTRLCEKYGWLSDKQSSIWKNHVQEDEKRQEKMVLEEKVQVNDSSLENEEKLSEELEKPHIDVNTTEISAEEGDNKKFQVLIDPEENIASHDAIYEKHARNHEIEDQEARNIETGREERRLDQESVDCCEMQGSMQKPGEEMMKNDEESNHYGAMLIRDKRHKNFYRMMQNDDATDFDDSFLYTPQLQCKEGSTQKDLLKKQVQRLKTTFEAKFTRLKPASVKKWKNTNSEGRNQQNRAYRYTKRLVMMQQWILAKERRKTIKN